MTFKNMSPVEQMDYLCRYLIIHSIIYYDLDSNVISDQLYNKKSKELEKLVQTHRNSLEECYYKDCLIDFTSATGFDLKYKLTQEHREYLERKASWILKLHDGEMSDTTKKGKVKK